MFVGANDSVGVNEVVGPSVGAFVGIIEPVGDWEGANDGAPDMEGANDSSVDGIAVGKLEGKTEGPRDNVGELDGD